MRKGIIYHIITLFLLSCNQNKTSPHVINSDLNKVQIPVPAVNKTFPTYTSDIYKKTIPDSTFRLLTALLPAWQLPAPNTWEKLWFHSYRKNGCLVDYIPADFNGDGKTDYCFLLRKKKQFAVWVLQSDKHYYRTIKLNDVGDLNPESSQLEFGIELMPKGKLDYLDLDKDTSAFIILKNPAITIMKFESAAETYFWRKGKYQSVTTGD